MFQQDCPEFKQLKKHYDDTLRTLARHTGPNAPNRERAIAVLNVAAEMLSQHLELCLTCRPKMN
jgi:hypothetical protein